MATKTFLLSLLKFVALVAPAIAILMQVVLESTDSDNPPTELRLLLLSLLGMLLSGLIIAYLLVSKVGGSLLSLAIIVVSVSLLLVAVSIVMTDVSQFWSAGTSKPGVKQLLMTKGTILGRITMAVAFVSAPFILLLYFGRSLIDQWLGFGYFSSEPIISPSVFFGFLSSIMVLQGLIQLFQNGILPNSDSGEVFSNSVSVGLTWLCVSALIISPVYILTYVLFLIPDSILHISRVNVIANFAHIWAILVTLFFFAVDVDLD